MITKKAEKTSFCGKILKYWGEETKEMLMKHRFLFIFLGGNQI